MNGLPQNVLLNFRLEFPKSGLTMSICLASGFFFFFFFFCFFGLRGKKKIDCRDKGREHDRRLAKRKKKCFWWNMDIRCHSPFKIVLKFIFGITSQLLLFVWSRKFCFHCISSLPSSKLSWGSRESLLAGYRISFYSVWWFHVQVLSFDSLTMDGVREFFVCECVWVWNFKN